MRCVANWEVCGLEVCTPGDEEQGGGVMDFGTLSWSRIGGVRGVWHLDGIPWVVFDWLLSHWVEAVYWFWRWWGGGSVGEEGVGEDYVANLLWEFVVEWGVGLWIYWAGEDLL